MRKIVILLLLGVTTWSCSKSDDTTEEKETVFYWSESQCADPWYSDDNGNEHVDTAVSNYLNANNITVTNVNFDYDLSAKMDCLACVCKTTRRIIVTVKESDTLKMKELNFYQ